MILYSLPRLPDHKILLIKPRDSYEDRIVVRGLCHLIGQGIEQPHGSLRIMEPQQPNRFVFEASASLEVPSSRTWTLTARKLREQGFPDMIALEVPENCPEETLAALHGWVSGEKLSDYLRCLSGKTAQAMDKAEKSALFIWPGEATDYPRRLALVLGRKDLKVIGVRGLWGYSTEYPRWSEVVLDHRLDQSRLTEVQRGSLERLLLTTREISALRRKTAR